MATSILKRSKVNWLYIFLGLLALSILNCSAAYFFTLPPEEGTSLIYLPKALYDRLRVFSYLLPILCLIVMMGLSIRSSNWTALFATIIMLVMYFGLSFLVLSFSIDDPTYTHLQSLQVGKQTYHLGATTYSSDSGLIFCRQINKRSICETFYSSFNTRCSFDEFSLKTNSTSDRVFVYWRQEVLYFYDVFEERDFANTDIDFNC